MKIGLLLGLLLSGVVAQAQVVPASGRTPASFIPKGYYQLAEGRAISDLNGDGRPDVVLALGPVAEAAIAYPDDNLPPRLLLVLWRTAAGYRLAAQSRQALLCKGCGGVFGDPFAGFAIEKGVLSLSHYGGSSWRWSLTAKFRFQQGDFYQIGDTYTFMQVSADECPRLAGGHRPGDQFHDVNLLTGAYQSVKVSEECRMLENRRGRQPVRPLQKLVAYKPAP